MAGPDTRAWTPLHAAIDAIDDGGDLTLLTRALDAGADPNTWDEDRACTPLLMAVFRGLHDCVRLLLRHGADPDVRGDEGDTPLSWAVETRDRAMLQLLLGAGCKGTLDAPAGAGGLTPLGAAVRASWEDGVVDLLAAGASPDARDLDGRTAGRAAPNSPVRP